jgi:Tol biopolymer transport system component
MLLSSGSRLGPYEIIAPLGAGGMGEVYRARDSRLGRDVAIKILPARVSSDSTLKQRFEREARTISKLNHPHICVLHDIGSQDGVDYLVMECIEGETLAKRLERGCLPPDQVLKFGAQIADALDKAHRCGVVHRDLKPGNIMLTATGAKLLDFGLAKPPAAPSSESTLTAAALPNSPVTEAGAILGTFQYMSPEQVEGREVDGRSDIFALGAVLYEMVTGTRAFKGKSRLSVASAILEKEPEPISALKPPTPRVLDHAIRLCLAKSPEDRWQTSRDLALELNWIAEGGSQAEAAPVAAPRRVRGLWVAATAAVSLAALGFFAGWILRPQESAPMIRAELNLPAGLQLDNRNNSLALSPDGRWLAFAATDPSGKRQIWLRSIDSSPAQPLAGTDDATYPFWSPDSRSIGFFAEHKLKRVNASGGTPLSLCDAPDARGGSWGSQGSIVFAPAAGGPLYMVPAAGGTPVQVSTLTGKIGTNRMPHFLPDGQHVLFYAGELTETANDSGGIYALDLKSKQMTFVAREESEGRYVSPGYLVFIRDGNLMAQPFDSKELQTTGRAVPIAEAIVFNPYRFNGEFAFSDSGLLVYASGSEVPASQLTWFDTNGQKLGTVGDPAPFCGVFLSPDDRQMIAPIQDPSSGRTALWLYDTATGNRSRFSLGERDFDFPAWSPDGKEIAFYDAAGKISVQPVDGSTGPRDLLVGSVLDTPQQWTRDGASLIYGHPRLIGYDYTTLPVKPGGDAKTYLEDVVGIGVGALSPDGKWFAYTNDDTGRYELYVIGFPHADAKRQISEDGASFPEWIDGGRDLAYVNAQNKLVVLGVKAGATSLQFSMPRILFGDRPLPGQPRAYMGRVGVGGPVYITSDGKRILLPVPVETNASVALTLVTQWTTALPQ